MEVYVDDMLIKTIISDDHVNDLAEMFGVLCKYDMKLNPLKCSFGIALEKFLCFIVNSRGIEANPEKSKLYGISMPLRTSRIFKV